MGNLMSRWDPHNPPAKPNAIYDAFVDGLPDLKGKHIAITGHDTDRLLRGARVRDQGRRCSGAQPAVGARRQGPRLSQGVRPRSVDHADRVRPAVARERARCRQGRGQPARQRRVRRARQQRGVCGAGGPGHRRRLRRADANKPLEPFSSGQGADAAPGEGCGEERRGARCEPHERHPRMPGHARAGQVLWQARRGPRWQHTRVDLQRRSARSLPAIEARQRAFHHGASREASSQRVQGQSAGGQPRTVSHVDRKDRDPWLSRRQLAPDNLDELLRSVCCGRRSVATHLHGRSQRPIRPALGAQGYGGDASPQDAGAYLRR